MGGQVVVKFASSKSLNVQKIVSFRSSVRFGLKNGCEFGGKQVDVRVCCCTNQLNKLHSAISDNQRQLLATKSICEFESCASFTKRTCSVQWDFSQRFHGQLNIVQPPSN